MEIKNKSILLNFGTIFASNIISQGLLFITTAILARKLGVFDYGKFASTLMLTSIIAQLSDLGLSNVYIIKKQAYSTKTLDVDVTALRLLISILISCIIELLIINNIVNININIVFLSLLANSIYISVLNKLQAEKFFLKYAIINTSVSILRTLIALIYSFYINHDNINLETLILEYLLCPLISIIFVEFSLVKNINIYSVYSTAITMKSESFKIFCSSAIYILLTRVDQLILKNISNPYQFGIYAAAMSVALSTSILTSALTNIFLVEEASNAIKFLKQNKFIILFSLFLGILFEYLISFYISNLIFGEQFKESNLPMFILFVANTFSFFINPLSTILYKKEKTQYFILTALIELSVILVVGYFLTTKYGALGMSIAFFISKSIGALTVFKISWNLYR